jgi:hypothetical protein
VSDDPEQTRLGEYIEEQVQRRVREELERLAQEREEAPGVTGASLERRGEHKRPRENNPTAGIRELQDWLLHMTSSDLPVYTKALLAYFAGRADGGLVRVPYTTASSEVGMSANSYYQHIKRALASGLIIKDGEFKYSAGDRRLSADAYRLQMPHRPP